MKIVHCIFSFNTGGAETMLIDIVNEQIKTQEVTVVIVNHIYHKELIAQLDKKIRLIFIGRKPHSYSILPLLRLNWILFRLHPDIIHLHNYAMSRIIFPLMPSKLFLTVHDLHISLKYVKDKTNLIAISNAVKDDISSKGNYKIYTIPNGINFERIEKRSNSGILNEKFRIVQVANLIMNKKGQDILINAISILKKRNIKNIEVSFIGTGNDIHILKQMADNLGVSEQIHFLGIKDRQYIYSHLKEYDLMCHPARYEGFGLCIAEGIAAMLPILVSDEGGPYEIIKQGRLGYAFQSGNAVDCADKIEYILKNYNDAVKLTFPAYEHAMQHYSIKRMVKKYTQSYKDANNK